LSWQGIEKDVVVWSRSHLKRYKAIAIDEPSTRRSAPESPVRTARFFQLHCSNHEKGNIHSRDI